uniref:Uncharacterized protein n=1 Tax=Arundo donax TaxID=35708 RepID=A0A0A8Z9C6_ARUDO
MHLAIYRSHYGTKICFLFYYPGKNLPLKEFYGGSLANPIFGNIG